MVTTGSSGATSEHEIVISRVIEGPRRLVFEAYTDAKHLAHWFGPNGFTTTTHRFELRPGGVWDFIMHGPDGTDYPNWVVWKEIVPPERLVWEHGQREGDPKAFLSTVTFVDRGRATELTLRSLFKTRQQRDEVVERYHAIEGAEQTLGRLAAYIDQQSKRGDRP
jgi:uncharacterized protein YndB with AHSA1/START domain